MKVCLYTAIFGDYETLKTPVKVDGLEYICFTDNLDLKSDVWKVVYVEKSTKYPPSFAYKKIKCLPHKFLSEYDITIWLDANFTVIDNNYLEKLLSQFKSNKLMLYKHVCLEKKFRDCAYIEGSYSLTFPKYSQELLRQQLNDYKTIHNFPENYGLYQSGFLMRNNKDQDVINFNEKWFEEIKKYGKLYPQCQVSLPFILWKTGITFDALDNIWDTQIYEITFHGSDQKFIYAYQYNNDLNKSKNKFKILFKFPSRSRPNRVFEVLDATLKNIIDKNNFNFLLSLDEDDCEMNNPEVISKLKSYPKMEIIFGTSESKVHAVNRDLNDYNKSWDILILLSDDMVPINKGFDETIRQKFQIHFPDLDGVLWFNDGFQKNRLNTLCILGKKYYERFNYIYHPSYKSLFCDNEFTRVAHNLNKQIYFDEIIIEHRHFSVGNNNFKYDDLYKHNDSLHDIDQQNFLRRAKNNFL
jgi:hypothetical protein